MRPNGLGRLDRHPHRRTFLGHGGGRPQRAARPYAKAPVMIVGENLRRDYLRRSSGGSSCSF
jgi:hypothetical protein